MPAYEEIERTLKVSPRKWLVTGVAGFIGSHLLETLLGLGQHVVGLDNFSTGFARNLDVVKSRVGAAWERFTLLEGDICQPEVCRQACEGVDYVLHQAALGSVPASIENPALCHAVNVSGFLNMLSAAKTAGVQRFVYASSSAVYGDDPELPKVEEKTGKPLSPYAASKAMDETYGGVFDRVYGFKSVGLRYFNVFGPRQDPAGAYAAVIPQWTAALFRGQPVFINGDGETSRDFCYVANVVQANLLAASVDLSTHEVFNVALGSRTTLNQLFASVQALARQRNPALPGVQPVYRDFRPGDIRHSVADIAKARRMLGFSPRIGLAEGLDLALDWYRGLT